VLVEFFPAWASQYRWALMFSRDGETVHECPQPSNTKAAGFMRNRAMIERARDLDGELIAVWDGRSRGTADSIDAARAAGLKTFVAGIEVRA
jgi:hypothetical protein